ncbi:MAG: galactose mutarotase [Clostridiaceae bacterium]|nr:galactose mutarotase [Clostridiaceae bacterium]
MSIRTEIFGKTKTGETVTKYTLQNQNGMEASFLDLGAIVVNLFAPDKNGVLEDVVLGYDTVEQYEVNKPAFGAVVGRCANRIANASFVLNNEQYKLDQNDETNCLHGGFNRYEHQMYQAEYQEGIGEDSITFSRISPDMEQGFPGELTYAVTYTLNDANELMVQYYAVSDQDTVVSLTNHTYFNIGVGGHKHKDVLDFELQVFSDTYTPLNAIHIPTGELRKVDGTALDFRKPHIIGERTGRETPDDSVVLGYDHNYVLGHGDGEIVKAAVCRDLSSGRTLEVYTDFPGVQVYTAVELANQEGKDHTSYGSSAGICFETQNFANAVNTPHFPSPILAAGEEYDQISIFRFGVIE